MCFLLADTLKIFREEVFTQNLYNIVACLSFLGTGYLFICRWLSSRKNIKTSIIDHAKVFGRIVQFFVSFQNQSTAPLTVHSVAIVYAAKEYPCELIPKKIRGKNECAINTPMFPLNLAPQHGYLCYLEFLNCEDILIAEGKTVVLKIHTNRGPIKKSIILQSKSHYLHIA
mgnify:FL=1|jgi:hypothetical protein